MAIQKSLDWQTESLKLQKQIRSIGYNPDLQKLLRNIGFMVNDLSVLEIEARRTHKIYKTEEKLKEISIEDRIKGLKELLLSSNSQDVGVYTMIKKYKLIINIFIL
mgnify:CR=1 FL=1